MYFFSIGYHGPEKSRDLFSLMPFRSGNVSHFLIKIVNLTWYIKLDINFQVCQIFFRQKGYLSIMLYVEAYCLVVSQTKIKF